MLRMLPLLLVVAVLSSHRAAAQAPGDSRCALATADVRDAVALGAGGRARAYDLTSIFTQPGAESPARVATPFVRLAWEAARAAERQEDLADFRVPDGVCTEEVWFVFPVLGREWAAFDEDGTPFDLAIRRRDPDSGGIRVRPSWVQEVPLTSAWRQALGPVPPSDRLIVGAFDRAALREGDRVEVWRQRSTDGWGGQQVQMRTGVIRHGDLTRWR